jgi:hypothetical protein
MYFDAPRGRRWKIRWMQMVGLVMLVVCYVPPVQMLMV